MSSFVHPESLPVCIRYKNRKISVNHNGVVSGLVVCEANENVQSLQTALHVCCVGKQRLILVFGGVAVGIFFLMVARFLSLTAMLEIDLD
jgi:hypothetical protein